MTGLVFPGKESEKAEYGGGENAAGQSSDRPKESDDQDDPDEDEGIVDREISLEQNVEIMGYRRPPSAARPLPQKGVHAYGDDDTQDAADSRTETEGLLHSVSIPYFLNFL